MLRPRLPAAFARPALIDVDLGAGPRDVGDLGHAEDSMLFGGDLTAMRAAARHDDRRMRLLARAGPDRYRAELVIGAFPAEGFRLGPTALDQLARLDQPAIGFAGRDIVRDIFVGNAAQNAGHQLAAADDVEHRIFLGLSLIHISEPTRQAEISYAVFCLKK